MNDRLTLDQLAQIDARITRALEKKSGISQDFLIVELSALLEGAVREIRASYAREDALQADWQIAIELSLESLEMSQSLKKSAEAREARLRAALEKIAVLAKSWYGHSIQEEVVKITRTALKEDGE